MGRRAVKPILTFKDMYVVNSHQNRKQYALSFDGGAVVIPSSQILDSIVNNFTVEVSFLKNSIYSIARLLGYRTGDIIPKFGFFELSIGDRYKVTKYDVVDVFFDIITDINIYQTLSLVYSSQEGVKMYKNGTLINTVQNTVDMKIAKPFPSKIGAGEDSFGAQDIKDLRIWSTPRTAQEIQDNYSKTLVGNESNLIFYPDFSTGEGSILYDKSSSNLHSTIESGVVWVELK